MQITVNGKLLEVRQARTIRELLEELLIPDRGTAVARNSAIVARERHAEEPVAEGDRIDILRPIGGG